MKNECLKSSVLAVFNLYFLLASRVRESALSRYPFSLIHIVTDAADILCVVELLTCCCLGL